VPLPSPVGIFVELALLPLAIVPLGAAIVRSGERIFGLRAALTAPERVLLALYAGGAVLFVLASIPLPIFGLPLVLFVLVGGGVGYAAYSFRERGRGLRSAFRELSTLPSILLCILTLVVLAVQVAGVASLTLGNMLDGSLYSLFLNLLLTHHTVAWTFAPYASVGVTYPQGAAVWMSLPVLLLRWPIVSTPLQFPGLFLALCTVGAYCLGQRLTSDFAGSRGAWLGLVFASFFGLVVTWPRLAIGGSFDFATGLPLFLLTLGWLPAFVRGADRSWSETAALGLVIGVEISLSWMLGFCTLLLFVGYWAVFRSANGIGFRGWALRWLAMVGIAATFLVRSLVGIALWFDYPGHVLLPVGNPPPAPPTVISTLTYRVANGELNPFVWLKPKISPFPGLTVEIQALLVAGLVVGALVFLYPRSALGRFLPRNLVLSVVSGAALLLALTVGLLLVDAASLNASGAESVTNIDEASDLLFIFYELIAILPLIVAASFLGSYRGRAIVRQSKAMEPPTHPGGIAPSGGRRGPMLAILAAVVIVVPVVSGLGITALAVPGYIDHHIEELANVTPADILALEWAGTNLPSCSRVLVAPGSVGQYLPEYAEVQVVFPAYPTPANLSYYVIVQDLDTGTYTNSTGALMLTLGITEVLVSAQNTVSFLPFQLRPLESSPDFRILTASGDVTILEFIGGATDSSCLP
jgi:hypothetical protein